MPVTTKYSIDSSRLDERLRRAREAAKDFRIPFSLIAKDFFQSQKKAFESSGPDRYPDLSPTYKRLKKARYGFIYPILEARGLLKKSLTDENDPNAVAEVVNRDKLLLGTKLPYAQYVQRRRKFLFIGPEASKYATGPQMERIERWQKIFGDHIKESLGGDE